VVTRNLSAMSGSNELMPEAMAELVVAAQAGDRSAFDELVRLTHHILNLTSLRKLARRNEAQPVVGFASFPKHQGQLTSKLAT